MASRFDNIYFIRNNAGTYEAWKDDEASATYSGTALVTDVLNSIEGAHTTGGYMVLFGVGTFDMGTENWTLNGDTDVAIVGAGMGLTIITNDTDAAADTEPISITNCDEITVSDLDISAGGAERTTSDALDFDNADNCLIERVRILLSRGAGIVFDGKDTGAQAINNTIRDCIITGTKSTVGHGIKLLGASYNTISGCYIYDTTGDGISIQKASNTAGQPNLQSNYNIVSAGTRIVNAGRDGVRIFSSSYNKIDAQITNSANVTASRDGVRIETNDSIQADGNQVGGLLVDNQGTATQRYGFNVAPDTASEAVGNSLVGAVVAGNNIGPVNDGGTRTLIRGNVGVADNKALVIAAAYTLTFDEPASTIVVDTSGGAVTATLPDAGDAAGRAFLFTRSGGSTATVARAGADTIGGVGANKTLDTDGAAIGLVSDGSANWLIISTEGTVA